MGNGKNMNQPLGKRISGRQQAILNEAEHAPSFVAAQYLFELSMQSDEDIAIEWKPIWERVREDAIREESIPQEGIAQIDKIIAELNVIDDLSRIPLEHEHNVCILLGAGASAPSPSNIPTVAQLLPELWRRARKLGREDIDQLAVWCEQRGILNIEDLLTAAYLSNFAAKNSSVSGLLNYFLFNERGKDDLRRGRYQQRAGASQVDAASVSLFQETLQGLFGLLTSTMIPAPPNRGHEEIVRFCGRHPRTQVVTTNYDGCLDEALLRNNISLNTYIEDREDQKGTLELIKIHGSINWTYCDCCHEVKEFELLSLKEGFEGDTITYPVVGICKNCGGQRRPLLIPPIGLKFIMFPNLIRLWNTARDRIESAEVLVIVGFSFSEADSYINKIIERSMSIKANQKMIICDPNARLVHNLRKKYSSRIEDFDNGRILAAVGSSDEVLEKVFQALLKKDLSERKSVPEG